MKNFLFLLAAGVWFGGCCPQTQSPAIVPYPNDIQVARGTYNIAGKPVTCDVRADEQTLRVVREFTEQLSRVSSERLSFAVSTHLPDKGVVFQLDTTLAKEAYRLCVTPKGVFAAASSFPGFLYALQSLKQMLPAAIYASEPAPQLAWTLPCVTINDAPRFAYRGMHLDVARHFFSTDEVKRYLDMMAVHKLNTFHWHLTDDQGWRIEIKRYPALTTVGSVRKATVVQKDWNTYDNTPYGGFYTQDQIREIVQYAADRAITIIPEIDLPGHMLAALTAYPELGCTGGPYEVWGRWGVSEEVLCPGQEKTFEFLEGVLTEVLDLFPSEYIHIGGDECPKVRWESCPRCQARIKALGLKGDGKHKAEHYLQSYVTERIETFLNARGRRIIGWDEILEGKVAPNATVMSWRGSEGGIEAAKLGHDVIMTPNSHFYFDYYQSLDQTQEPFGIGGYIPVERVYSYDPAFSDQLTSEQQKHIIGIQANMWSEYIAQNDHLEYMLLPRLAALSEVQWCQPEVKDWKRFIGTFRMEEIYTAMGFNFAKNIYGVSAAFEVCPEEHCVEMKLTTQGNAPIYYTLDGSDPTAASLLYTAPVKLTQSCTFKAVVLRDKIQTPIYEHQFTFSLSTGRPAVFNTQPTQKYTYGGALALVDGYHGATGYTNGAWVGFLNAPLDVTLDMQGAGSYSSVDVETLVEKGEWVFPPSAIEVATSDDGQQFTTVATQQLPEERPDSADGVKNFEVSFPATQARYLRVVARTVNPIPTWHGAKGEPAHLFVGEIAVK
ncbi:MAG: family 20 glycosylhydrolase [Alistipes sp.]